MNSIFATLLVFTFQQFVSCEVLVFESEPTSVNIFGALDASPTVRLASGSTFSIGSTYVARWVMIDQFSAGNINLSAHFEENGFTESITVENSTTTKLSFQSISLSNSWHGIEYYLQVSGPTSSVRSNSAIIRPACGQNTYEYAGLFSPNCKSCPFGLLCNGTVHLRVGYDRWRPHNLTPSSYECGFPFSRVPQCRFNSTTGSCLPGSIGPRCSGCENGFGKGALNHCIACGDEAYTIIMIVLVLGSICFGMIFVAYFSFFATDEEDVYPSLLRLLLSHLATASVVGDFGLKELPLFLAYVFDVMRTGARPSTQFSALDCVNFRIDYYDRFIIMNVLPVVVCILGSLVGLIILIRNWQIDRGNEISKLSFQEARDSDQLTAIEISRLQEQFLYEEEKKNRRFGYKELFLGVASVSFFCFYPTLMEQCFGVWRCDTIDVGSVGYNSSGEVVSRIENRLWEDRTVFCGTSQHQMFVIIGVTAGCFWFLIVPLISAAAIYRSFASVEDRDGGIDLTNETGDANEGTNKHVILTGNDQAIAAYKSRRCVHFLAVGYRNKCKMWEVVTMTRKAALALLISFACGSPKRQTYYSMWILSGYFVAHVLVQPYVRSLLNRLEAISLGIVIFSLNCSLLFEFYPPSDNSSLNVNIDADLFVRIILTVLIALPNLGFVAALLVLLVRDCHKKFKLWLVTQLAQEGACGLCRGCAEWYVADFLDAERRYQIEQEEHGKVDAILSLQQLDIDGDKIKVSSAIDLQGEDKGTSVPGVVTSNHYEPDNDTENVGNKNAASSGLGRFLYEMEDGEPISKNASLMLQIQLASANSKLLSAMKAKAEAIEEAQRCRDAVTAAQNSLIEQTSALSEAITAKVEVEKNFEKLRRMLVLLQRELNELKKTPTTQEDSAAEPTSPACTNRTLSNFWASTGYTCDDERKEVSSEDNPAKITGTERDAEALQRKRFAAGQALPLSAPPPPSLMGLVSNSTNPEMSNEYRSPTRPSLRELYRSTISQPASSSPSTKNSLMQPMSFREKELLFYSPQPKTVQQRGLRRLKQDADETRERTQTAEREVRITQTAAIESKLAEKRQRRALRVQNDGSPGKREGLAFTIQSEEGNAQKGS